jgi:hypothetical protein
MTAPASVLKIFDACNQTTANVYTQVIDGAKLAAALIR